MVWSNTAVKEVTMAEIDNARIYPYSYEKIFRPHATWTKLLLFLLGAKKVPCERVNDHIVAPNLKAAICALNNLLRDERKKGWNTRMVSLSVGGKKLTYREAIMRTHANKDAILGLE